MVSSTAMSSSINCPACAAAIDSVSPLSRTLVCDHCGNLVRFDNSRWVSEGTFSAPLDAPPLLRVGRQGKLHGKDFQVEGRVRLADDQSQWDEWWLMFDNNQGIWLEEDDGSYHLHTDAPNMVLSNLDELRSKWPGQTIEADARQWFITETGEASVTGMQGQLPVSITPGLTVNFLDAVADGQELSIEIWMQEYSASVSSVLDPSELIWADS